MKSKFVRVMPDHLNRRSPDYDPDSKYYIEDELGDMRADEAERQWREEREDEAYA